MCLGGGVELVCMGGGVELVCVWGLELFCMGIRVSVCFCVYMTGI